MLLPSSSASLCPHPGLITEFSGRSTGIHDGTAPRHGCPAGLTRCYAVQLNQGAYITITTLKTNTAGSTRSRNSFKKCFCCFLFPILFYYFSSMQSDCFQAAMMHIWWCWLISLNFYCCLSHKWDGADASPAPSSKQRGELTSKWVYDECKVSSRRSLI